MFPDSVEGSYLEINIVNSYYFAGRPFEPSRANSSRSQQDIQTKPSDVQASASQDVQPKPFDDKSFASRQSI